jgi:cytoskeletal protein CcmA (bactofilin family)
MTLFRPWAVSQTMYTQSFSTNDGIYANGAGRFTGAVTSDGFLINRGSGTMTGAVRVYGYRN